MKNLLALVILLALIASIAYYWGWFDVSTSSDKNHDKIEVIIDKDKIRHDSSKVKENVKEVSMATQDGISVSSKGVENRYITVLETTFDLNKNAVELPENSKAEVIAMRSGIELKELQLNLNVSLGSYLVVSGGLFKEGSTSAIITIKAPRGSHDGRVFISCMDSLQTVTVTVTH